MKVRFFVSHQFISIYIYIASVVPFGTMDNEQRTTNNQHDGREYYHQFGVHSHVALEQPRLILAGD